MKLACHFLFLSLFLAIRILTAQNLTTQIPSTPTNSVVVKAARWWDGKSATTAPNGLIVVANGEILAVGSIPVGINVTRTIDLGDATLLPGFMDAHTHLAIPTMADGRAAVLSPLQKTPAERAIAATADAKATAMAGFTTVRDLGSSDFIDVGLRNNIRANVIPGPRILAAISGIGTTGGHCDGGNGFVPGILTDDSKENVADGPDSIRRAVRTMVKHGADVIKVCATGGVLSLNSDVGSPQLTQEELNALVDQAHSLGKKAAAHAHGAEGAKRAIRAGIDSIEHGSFLDNEALELMKQKGTVYIPTLLALEGLKEPAEKGMLDPRQTIKFRVAARRLDETFRSALAKGVRIGYGTDAGVFRHGRNAEEFLLMTKLGMSNLDALKAATSVNAELFGIRDKAGSIEAGNWADIVAVPGDPLKDISVTQKVFFVMRDGFVIREK
jgi:imidazolonepropionase-like amidohydrolase